MDHLSKVAKEARAMGLSYGKYVALVREGLIQPKLEPKPEPDAKETAQLDYVRDIETCVICGKEFRPGRGRAMTCGPECRMELNRRRARKIYREQRGISLELESTCKFCGKVFSPERIGVLYCSVKCRSGMDNMRRRKFKPGATKICAWCGKEFTISHGGTKYCGKDCYNAARIKLECERVSKRREKAKEEKENC